MNRKPVKTRAGGGGFVFGTDKTNREPGSRGRGGGLFLAAILGLFLTACGTCVDGKVTVEGVALEGSYVQLLDKDHYLVREAWTDRYGEYCFDAVPKEKSYWVKAEFDGREREEPVTTGSADANCRTGGCVQVNLDFACTTQDPREPNNACIQAPVADLPFFEPRVALCPPGDVDFYRVEVEEDNLNLVVSVGQPQESRYFYFQVGIFDDQCNLLEERVSYDGAIIYPLPRAGTYHVGVTSPEDPAFQGEHEDWGSYEIEILAVPEACVQILVQQDGTPLAGAEVTRLGEPYDSCYTDGDGSCCMQTYVGVNTDFWVCNTSIWDCLLVQTNPTQPGTCADIGTCETKTVDFDYTCVSGTVTRNGEPLENVEVNGPYGTAVTGIDGAYCLKAPKDQDVYHNVFERDLCLYHSTDPVFTSSDGSCEEGGCTPLNIQLPDMSCVNGTVVRDGNPVTGAQIFASVGCSYLKDETEADGTFCFTAPGQAGFSVTACDPQYPVCSDLWVETQAGGDCDTGGCLDVMISLPGITCLSGTVVREDGTPAAGVRVESALGQTLTRSDGGYCLDVVADMPDTWVSFYDPVTGLVRHRYVATGQGGSCESGGCTGLNETFPATACIAGTLTRQDGQSPSGARVCLGYGDPECGTPDPEGRFCIRAPVEEEVWIYLQDPATGYWADRLIRTGAAGSCADGECVEADFVLPAVSCVRGSVTREGVPVEGARVCPSTSWENCAETGPGGDYCVTAQAGSTVCVYVEDPVLGTHTGDCTQTPASGSCASGGCVTVNLPLAAVSCISGTVREGTEPLQGALVINGYGRAYTNEEGRFCLSAVPGTSQWIQCEHPRDGSQITRYPTILPGGRCQDGNCSTQNFTFDLKKQ